MEKENWIFISATLLIFVVAFSFLMSSPTYTGRVIEVNNLDDALNNLEGVKDEYNENVNKLPGFISRIFGNELMRIEITRRNGSVENVDVKTIAGKVVQVDNINGSYTMEVYTNENTFDKILGSEDQLKAFKKALDKKEIEYKALTFKTKLKMGTIRTILAVRSFFW